MQVNDLEIKRKLFHLIAGIILVFLLDLEIINISILTIILIIGIILSLVSKKLKIPIVSWFLEKLDRKEHLEKYPGIGAINFIAGSLLAVILFDKDLALASILVLTLGDAVGSLVGIHFGRTKHPLNTKKLLEGTIAGIVVAFVGASIFISYREALVAAIAGMIIEAIELKVHREFIVSDNITIPLISGLAVSILRLFS